MTLIPTKLRRREGIVELHDLAGVRLTDPFLGQTVTRLAMSAVERPWTAFVDADAGTGRAPDAIIFHVGRCGSSLLVNMLNAGGARVVSESQVVNAAIRDLLDASTPQQRDRAALALRTGIDVSCALLNEEPISVLKTTSWNLAAADRLRELYPDARIVFLTRAVTDVVRSNLRRPPAWAGMRTRPREQLLGLFPALGDAPTDLSEAGFYAYTWLSGQRQAAALPGLLTVDYATLASEPSETLDRILRHIGWNPPADQRPGMLDTVRWNAKDRSRSFDAERDAPPALSDADARTVAEVAAIDA